MNKTWLLGLLTLGMACSCTGETTTSSRDDAGVDASSDREPDEPPDSDEGEGDDADDGRPDSDDDPPDDTDDDASRDSDDDADDTSVDDDSTVMVDADVSDDDLSSDSDGEPDAATDDMTDDVDDMTDDEVTDDMTDDEVTDDMTDDEVTDDVTDDDVTDDMTDDEVTDDMTDDEVTDDVTDDEVTDDVTDDEVTDDMTDDEVTDDMTDDEITDAATDDDVTDDTIDASPPEPVEAGPEPPNYNPCTNGTWDHDANPQTPCQAHQVCDPGEFVAVDPTPTADRECRACTAGTFSTVSNATGCASWTTCLPGQIQTQLPTATNDRVCAGDPIPDCATGTWDHDDNYQTACVPHTTCTAGQYVLTGGTATTDRQCASCVEGAFSTAPNSLFCTLWRNCGPGERVLFGGSSTANRTCQGCASGFFNTTTNASACTPWTNCPPTTFVEVAPTSTSNRVCADCPDGMSTPTPNQSQCVTPEDCDAGTVQVGVDAGFPICEECEAGEHCAGADAPVVSCGGNTFDDDGDPATSCETKTSCAPGQEIDDPGDAVTDRTCADCPQGEFTSAPNTDDCSPHTECTDAEFLGEPGTETSDNVCVAIEVVQVVTGGRHTCALLNDGHVRCWGAGGAGQLGYGNNQSLSSPGGNVGGGLQDAFVTQLSAGTSHTCALLEGGAVSCWGDGANGRLGYPDGGSRQSPGGPVPLPEDAGVAEQVVAGYDHTCVLMSNGTITCWGADDWGQLGYPGEAVGAVPLGDEADVVMALSAGYRTTCALFDNGTVRCTGFNWEGNIGIPPVFDDPSPDAWPINTAYHEFQGDLDFGVGAFVSRLAMNDGGHSCAVIEGPTPGADDTLRCWGAGNAGRLGYGNTQNRPTVLPMSDDVPLGGNVSLVAAGDAHTCALLTDGGLRCWGRGSDGRLGYGNNANVGDGTGDSIIEAGDVELGLTGGVEVKQIAAGGSVFSVEAEIVSLGHTCVLLSDGNVRCWGFGENGQLGYGDNLSLNVPGDNVSFALPPSGDAGL